MSYDVVFTKQAFADKLIHIATEVDSLYKNKYPQNCGYYNGSKFSWDCWNLVKSLIWGWQEERTEGYFCYQPDLYGLGDWDGGTIMSYCTDVSSDFSNLTVGEFLLTAAKDHAGVYVGEFTDRSGQPCNVVECTTTWNENRVIGSWVDPDGTRRNCKDGLVSKFWARHGKLPWVDYSDPVPPEPPKPDVLDVDGSWGQLTTQYSQQMLGTPIDGIISNQPLRNKQYLPNASTTSWQFKWIGYGKGSDFVRALQNLIGTVADGWFGKQSVIALQVFLQMRGYYNDAIDGSMGYNTVCAWQQFVNAYFKQ